MINDHISSVFITGGDEIAARKAERVTEPQRLPSQFEYQSKAQT
jgi:hypothetical protein